MNRAGLALLFFFTGLMPGACAMAADRDVVLVAAADSSLGDLDALALRKIFLGYPVTRDNRPVKGLRNTGDDELDRIFLQTVVAMSEKSYRRRLLTLAVRQGIPRPAEYDRIEDLVKALSSRPNSVSYMWKDDAQRSPDIKILKILWHP